MCLWLTSNFEPNSTNCIILKNAKKLARDWGAGAKGFLLRVYEYRVMYSMVRCTKWLILRQHRPCKFQDDWQTGNSVNIKTSIYVFRHRSVSSFSLRLKNILECTYALNKRFVGAERSPSWTGGDHAPR